MVINSAVKVVFSQHGTWGDVGFEGELFWENKNDDLIAKLLGSVDCNCDPVYAPALRITEGPAQYVGLTVRPGQELPGMFAEGYNHPLSGKCYTGRLMIGDTAATLNDYSCPQCIYAAPVNYLHIEGGEELSDDQRTLLLEAVRFDRDARFPAGRSVCELFTRDEMEGEKKGKVFYA